jgi:hypothetical protein
MSGIEDATVKSTLLTVLYRKAGEEGAPTKLG